MSHMIIATDQMKNVLILVMDHDVNVKMVTNGVMVIAKVLLKVNITYDL
jgi:hypothetical protein